MQTIQLWQYKPFFISSAIAINPVLRFDFAGTAPVHFLFVFAWKRKDQQINLNPTAASPRFYHFKSFTSSPFPVIWNSYSLWDISVMRLKISSRHPPAPPAFIAAPLMD